MKKIYIIGTLAALAILILGVAGYAYAQSQDDNTNAGTGVGCGMFGTGNGRSNGGRGMMGFRGNNQSNTTCPMFDGDEDGTTGCLDQLSTTGLSTDVPG